MYGNVNKVSGSTGFCARNWDSSALESHRSNEERTAQHVCNICGRGFGHVSSMLRHQRTYHSSEKLHQCLYCTASYKHRHNLKRHLESSCKGVPKSQ